MSVKQEESERIKLCRELLELRSENRKMFERVDAINSKLKAIATDEGNFRETLPDLGYVTVSGEKDPRSDGMHPIVDEPKFYALPKSAARGLSQAKLIEAGIIKEELKMTGKSYGRVTQKLFAEEA